MAVKSLSSNSIIRKISIQTKMKVMKKTYIIPTTDVIPFKTSQQLLAASAILFDNEGNGEIYLLQENPDNGEAM